MAKKKGVRAKRKSTPKEHVSEVPAKMDWIDRMSEQGAKNYLRTLTGKLDDCDGEDFFGTEGWRHALGLGW